MSTEEKRTPAAWRRPSIIDRAQWSYSTHEPAAWSEREALYDEATVRRLSAEVQELREALRPFAELSDIFEATGASKIGGPDMGLALRRARAALKPERVND